ncbi:FAD/NAD(P)-binding protein [Autumnicola musiva]|uniref:FAD/NAD(P)-binding protein n=1 Tax=Autumnicola musiva TaxID=3075589 RepID=A0ABU3D9A9_9FLAO|nr:FAD/NAD(P)-binding protein [Zunongwangia sp. F117]MDT0678107.1 FAD/NAD(P)-binding protein [Zunongwangia sp. F117]
MKNLCIIGGGACGSAAFIEMVLQICSLGLHEKLSLTLIERREKFGYGMAFGTPEKSHLLNTRADLMGIYANEPKDFSDWLKAKDQNPKDIKGEGYTEAAYTRRILYGEYVSEQLERFRQVAKEHKVQVNFVQEEAVDIHRQKDEKLHIELGSGKIINSDFVLLAPGTSKPNKFRELRQHDGYIDFPWPVNRIEKTIKKDDEVGILGSSLSAIDTVMTLVNNGHRGKISLISHKGILPRVQPTHSNVFHRKHLTLENIHKIQREKLHPPRVKELFRLYIKDVEEAEGKKMDWKKFNRSSKPAKELLEYDISAAEKGGDSLLNITYSLRYDAGVIWKWMSLKQKKIFKKWLGTQWAANRHAMPLHNAKQILELFEKERLRVISQNREVKFSNDSGKFTMETKSGDIYDFDKIINATGTASALKGMDNKLIEKLLEKNISLPILPEVQKLTLVPCR